MNDFTLDDNGDSSIPENNDVENQELENDETAESSTAHDDMDDSSTSEEMDAEDGDLESDDESEADPIKALKSEKANQRFSEITTRAKAAEDRAAALEARLDAMQNAEIPAFDNSNPPRLDQFDDYDQFTEAQTRYVARQAVYEENVNYQQAQRQAYDNRQSNELFAQHQRRREALLKVRPDLPEALRSMQLNNQTTGGAAAAQAILRSPNGEAVEYHVAKNADLARKLNGMDQYDAMMEVQRISERLKIKPKPRADLPDPIGSTPSGGGKSSGFKPKFSAGATFS